MNTDILVSVVVPVYNVKKFLEKCIQSIINQTLKKIEIIIIDDGSCDGSEEIIDKFAKIDNRIVAIHQENIGYGYTVNKGIKLARGEYIGIIESDDWIEKDMYEKLYKVAKENNSDLARCGFSIYNSLKHKNETDYIWEEVYDMFNYVPNTIFNPREYKKIFMYHSAIWTYIYKKDIIKSSFLNEKSRSYQDFPFVFEILAKSNSLVVIKECLHHYRMEDNQGSSSTTKSVKSMQMIDMSEYALDILKEKKLLNGIEKEFFQHCILANKYFYNLTPDSYKKEYANRIKKIFDNVSENIFDGLDEDSKRWLVEIGIIKREVVNIFQKIKRFFYK